MSEFEAVDVSDLFGASLDWAVMKTEGDEHWSSDRNFDWWPIHRSFRPSASWADCGPLIEKHRVTLIYAFEEYEALIGMTHSQPDASPLVAACRAIVASVLGDTVSVPKELV